jgi:CBS domain containing-hemolysin-like protein
MHASDLVTRIELVDRTTNALAAAQLVARDGHSTIIIADKDGKPVAVISALDVLALLIPHYLRDDMALAGVFDENGAEEIWTHAKDRTVGELLDDDKVNVYDILRVDADASIVEVAARMANERAQVALVTDENATEPGFVRLPTVMDAIIRFCATKAGEAPTA